MTLRGKVFVVTGAGRGIGRAEACCLAREGARVLVNDRGTTLEGEGHDPQIAETVADEIRRAGGEAVANSDDVSLASTADTLIALARDSFGRIDGVIANAGISRDRALLKTDDADIDAIVGTHLIASMRLTRAAARAIADQDEGGSILLTTSAAGFFGNIRQSSLAAASGAIAGFVRSVAVELKRHRIRVNAIAPTARTRQTENLPLFQGISADSMSPDYVARVAAFLLSDAAEEITGEVIGVAGARTYAFRTRETPGHFAEPGDLSINDVKSHWREVVRGS